MTNTFSSKPIDTWLDSEITVGRIGHSTVLINFYGTWIITDPVFGNQFGVPFVKTGYNFGVKRVRSPYIHIHSLPPIDIILLSHAHMDHLHPWSCKHIVKHSKNKTQVITALGVSQWLSASSLQKKTIELDRGQSIEVSGTIITACEVNHRGARYPWSRDRSKGHSDGASYNAYMIEKDGKRLFFGGDTAYTDAMKSYAPIGGVDLAIMPIGSYDPWITSHCNPEQSLQMAKMLDSKNIVGIHRDSRGWPAKKREGEAPINRFLKSAPSYDMNVLRKYEGEVITL